LLLAMAGRDEEAWDHIRAGNSVLDGVVETDLGLTSRYVVAEAMALLGDLAGAEKELAAMFTSIRDARGEGPEARALRVAGELALLVGDQGRWEDADAYLRYGQEVDALEPARGKLYPVLRLAARGRVAAHRGELGDALALVERAVEFGDENNLLNYRARAR